MFWLGLALGMAVLAAAGSGILLLVRTEIQKQVGGALSAVLDSQIDVVRAWIAERKFDVQLAASRKEVRSGNARLLASEYPSASCAVDCMIVSRC